MITNEDLFRPGTIPSGGVKMLSVFAVDPGDTTGWAWTCVGAWELDMRNLLLGNEVESDAEMMVGDRLHSRGRMRFGEVSHTEDVKSFLGLELDAAMRIVKLMELADEKTRRLTRGATGLTHVVCEDFETRQGTKDRSLHSPVRLAAMLYTLVCQSSTLSVEFLLQNAALGKGTINDSMLEARGMWWPGKQHARDAGRHLVTAIRRMRPL